ncbi:ribosome maturation factor RimM [Candidatus Liberibacter americanus]|uniref:Ribosome maturation factor RimM n=1 Tax=Candidatus Liberibacter americanus str. Sao Paulo TaxID=1261131 RepID=U6B780_9HYPH|nr:ribosome maturation factor RimM [Candidatus Liberibacter americanus]AHA27612.1 RimM protein [Candidatus Liberibacter americanus str. Sao Paulo]EMS36320.1 16S rRNA-processing protein [Candidatus Liberibacter americanus PW_SP]
MVGAEKLILMATIGSSHGLNGGLYVNSYANDPMELERYTLYSNDGREFSISEVYEHNKRYIVFFDGINDRTAAEKLRNLDLYVNREDFKDEELEEDEFFHADLERMETFDIKGKYWGNICGIYDFGAGTIIEIKSDNVEKKFLIPFTKEAVLNVNMKENKILIDPIAAGLNCIETQDKNIKAKQDLSKNKT